MTYVKDIYSFLNELFPVNTQESFDNCGHLIGSSNKAVKKVLLSLDATSEVIREAENKNVDLIITHHPIIFGSFKQVIPENSTGKKIIQLSKDAIAVISMHTNLDKAINGVNDVLVKTLGAESFEQYDENPYIRIGYLKSPMNIEEYLRFCKNALKTKGLRYYNSGKDVYKIACVGGAGDSDIYDAINLGCDTFITSDIKYHIFLDAKEYGINLIDGDHFCTENPVLFKIKDVLENSFRDVKFLISKEHSQTANFYV